MTNKLVVIINSLKYPKLRKFYYMKWNFLYKITAASTTPWLGGYRLQITVLSVLNKIPGYATVSNYRFLQDPRLALRWYSFFMQCWERLLHQNKLVALSAHQITCLLSIMGLNYRGRPCQLVARWSHMDRAESVRRACVWVSCVVDCCWYRYRCL